jgi:hypothetical protein
VPLRQAGVSVIGSYCQPPAWSNRKPYSIIGREPAGAPAVPKARSWPPTLLLIGDRRPRWRRARTTRLLSRRRQPRKPAARLSALPQTHAGWVGFSKPPGWTLVVARGPPALLQQVVQRHPGCPPSSRQRPVVDAGLQKLGLGRITCRPGQPGRNSSGQCAGRACGLDRRINCRPGLRLIVRL